MAVEAHGTTLVDHDRARSQRILMLEFGSRTEFDEPHLEYRRLFSELLGTFMLVLVAAGGGILHAKGQISLAAAVVAPGLMVMAIILFMGAPRDRLRRSERGRARGPRGRRLHRARWPVVGAGQRHLDEPRPLPRTGPGERRLEQLLGLCRRAARRCGDRGRLCADPAWPRRRSDSHAAGSGVLTPGRREAATKLSQEIDATSGSPRDVVRDRPVVQSPVWATIRPDLTASASLP